MSSTGRRSIIDTAALNVERAVRGQCEAIHPTKVTTFGFPTVRCVLPVDHDGPHETNMGSRWEGRSIADRLLAGNEDAR